ncbi:MAG: hypothetical protein IIZ35_04075 [Clostridia bacterium]|nr:hypothetical protein [Clostridia bacterium]
MLCPRCFEDNHITFNTRSSSEYIYRERRCKNCGLKWKTVEIDLDRVPEDYREGDGYFENSTELNRMLRLTKPKGEEEI